MGVDDFGALAEPSCATPDFDDFELELLELLLEEREGELLLEELEEDFPPPPLQ